MMMTEQLPRHALLWLIGSQIAMLLALMMHLPPWILLLALVTSVWRFQVHRGRWSWPPRWARALMAVAAAAAVWFSFGSLLGLEPMVALLLVASALKLLEARSQRDGYVLAILGFFICLTLFLFDQSIPSAIYALFCVALLLSALVALNQGAGVVHPSTGFRLSAGLLAQALPLMLLPFLFFPRIAPLWSVPLKRHGAETGMSDALRPGDVAKLGQNDAVAFRVRFEGDIPPMRELYWRGLTLGWFEDGTWYQHQARSMPEYGRLLDEPVRTGPSLRYRVIQRPTQQRWLYGLRYAKPEGQGVIPTSDFRFVAPMPLDFEFGYRVESWPDVALETDLPEWRKALEVDYPRGRDPQTRALIRAWQAEAASPEALVRRALQWFRTQPFFYTLEPPAIGDRDFVDRFLFDTRRGFCEHYAYSFVVMMRQAGIPARLVAGYQGGEINPVSETVIVRQLDAHAWAEVWLVGKGWVRVDPTAAVSPARVELGLAGALGNEAKFLADSPLSAFRYRDIGIINWLRMRYDAIAWQWQNVVVGFGGDTQIEVLKRLLGEITPSRMALFVLAGAFLILTPGTWWLLRAERSARPPPAERDFRRLCRELEKYGVERKRGETLSTYFTRAMVHIPADRKAHFQQRVAWVEDQLYGRAEPAESAR